jgi:hypothetical protein
VKDDWIDEIAKLCVLASMLGLLGILFGGPILWMLGLLP